MYFILNRYYIGSGRWIRIRNGWVDVCIKSVPIFQIIYMFKDMLHNRIRSSYERKQIEIVVDSTND